MLILSPQLEQYIENARLSMGVPGLALAVVKDDQVLFTRGYGLCDLDRPEPVDEHTTFAIASITKSFTATALAMLVDQGLVDWDGRVSDYLPGFELMDIFASREMRVRDLFTHRSGLPEVSGGTIWYGSDLPRDEVVHRLRYLRPVTGFRSSYAYQNVMYLAAGMIIPAVTGLSWDDFVQSRIFDPLGMRDSAPNYARARSSPNMAVPYASVPYLSGTPARAIPYRDHDNIAPAASIHASAWDLAQYLRLHLSHGLFAGQALVSPASSAALHAPQVVIPPVEIPPAFQAVAPRFTSYALGWRVQDFRGQVLVEHSGGVDGMRTLVSMLPEQDLGVVTLTNKEAPLTRAVSYRVLDACLDAPDFDWAAFYQEAGSAEEARRAAEVQERMAARASGAPPSLPLEAYAGRYPSPLVDALRLSVEEDHLVLRFAHTPGFTADLSHWHYDTFRLDWRDPYVPWGLVTFRLDSRGQVDALKLDQPNLLDVDFRELGELKKAR